MTESEFIIKMMKGYKAMEEELAKVKAELAALKGEVSDEKA